MAQRPIWRGHLRLALVSCPVALYSAKHDRSSIKFNLINPETGNRIKMLTVDGETDKPLERRNLVKGYEFRKNTYLLLSNEDLESVKVESSEVMNVEKFVDAHSIDPLYYDTGYYLAPDGSAGRDVYQILREAIGRTDRVALSRVVIGQRERVIAIRLYEKASPPTRCTNSGTSMTPAACSTNRCRSTRRWSSWRRSSSIVRRPPTRQVTSRTATRRGCGR